MKSLSVKTERPIKVPFVSRAPAGSLAWLALSFVVLLPAAVISAGPFTEDFSGPVGPGGVPGGWETLEFPKIKRHTSYGVEREGEESFLRAESRNSASGIYKELSIDLKEHPVLSWRWKVEGIIEEGDARVKHGDDYPARIYVVFEYDPDAVSLYQRLKYKAAKLLYGNVPATAINYIWANRLPRGEHIKNPFTDKAIMVAVESGPEMAGRWIIEERNVYEDYRAFFGTEPPAVVGIAIMTDSDNTGRSAVAYYDDIAFGAKSE